MRKITLILMWIPLLMLAKGKTSPAWVQGVFPNSGEWYGVGKSELSDQDYVNKANKEAFAALSQQISVKIEANSLATIDLHKDTQFKQTITTESNHYLEGQQLVGTYQDGIFYYVCYKLSPLVYEQKLHQQAQRIAQQGYEYYQSAENAKRQNHYEEALSLFVKGMELIKPWNMLDLHYNNENVPMILLHGIQSTFDNLAIELTDKECTAYSFQSMNQSIVAHLFQNGSPVANFPLSATFVEGSGSVTPIAKTDSTGSAIFYLSQITDKRLFQQIRISVDKQVKQSVAKYETYIQDINWPEALFAIQVQKKSITAFVNDHSSILDVAQLENILNTNCFDIVQNQDVAKVLIEVTDDVNYAGVVHGEMNDMLAYETSAKIKITDINTKRMILNFSTNTLRVLVEENTSEDRVRNACSRELMKNINKKLHSSLQKINIE